MEYLQALVDIKVDSLQHAPEGRIKGNRHGTGWQYYIRENGADKNGKYISKDQIKLAKALGQKEYDKRILSLAQNELRQLKRLESARRKSVVEDAYDNLPLSIQELVTPIETPLEEFIQEWMSKPYEGLPFSEDDPEYYSEKDERMRSKSEVLIANLLVKYDIPYLYEKPLFLDGVGVVYPDFTLLGRNKREEKYLEHLGMLDDPNYTVKSFRKISSYEQNGIFLGERLLVTYETSKQPLNTRLLERKIVHWIEQL